LKVGLVVPMAVSVLFSTADDRLEECCSEDMLLLVVLTFKWAYTPVWLALLLGPQVSPGELFASKAAK
jgi:hypothetical protein